MQKIDDKCCEDDKPYLCPVEGIINTISKKWAICIISRLGSKEEGYRFNELQRSLKGISAKSLSDRLKDLDKENLVHRDVKETVPPKVTYTLTKDGKELYQHLKPLMGWIEKREG